MACPITVAAGTAFRLFRKKRIYGAPQYLGSLPSAMQSFLASASLSLRLAAVVRTSFAFLMLFFKARSCVFAAGLVGVGEADTISIK